MTARDRTVVIAIAGLLLVVAAWFLLLSPVRKDASALGAETTAAQQRLTTAQTQVASSAVAKSGYRRDYTIVSQLGKAVPADDDVPSLIVLLQGAAHQSKVDFRSIDLSTNAAASAAPTQTTAADSASSGTTGATGSDSGSSSGGDTSADAGSAPATQAAASTLPPGSSVGAAGFPTLPFDFTFTGSFFKLQDLLGRLDRFTEIRGKQIVVHGRLLTVDGFALSPGPKGFPDMVASLHATAYLLPADAAATPAVPTPGGAVAAVPSATPGAPTTPAPSEGTAR